jgi:CP family cyanate transporter-like MFS transporter
VTAVGSAPTKNALVRGRFLVFAGIVVVAFGLRSAATAVSPILLTIEKDIPFDALSIGLLGMLAPFTFAIFGAVTPTLARRLGLEWSIIVASGVIAVGELARALSHDTASFLAWTFVSLAGTGAASVLLPPLVKKFYPDRIGGMTTIYGFMAVMGSVVPAYLAAPIASGADWRISIALWGYIAVLALFPWVGQIITERGHATHLPQVSNVGVTGRVWRSKAAWAITVSFAIAAFNCYIMWAWLPIMLQERAGMSESESGLMLALYTAMALPNSIIAPLLIVRAKSVSWLVLFGMAAIIVGALGLWLLPATLTWLWVALSGFGVIFFTISLVLINLRTSSPAGAVALSGMSQGVGYLIGAFGPLAVGLIHSLTSDWTLEFVIIIATALVGIFPMIVLRRKVLVDAPRESVRR